MLCEKDSISVAGFEYGGKRTVSRGMQASLKHLEKSRKHSAVEPEENSSLTTTMILAQ